MTVSLFRTCRRSGLSERRCAITRGRAGRPIAAMPVAAPRTRRGLDTLQHWLACAHGVGSRTCALQANRVRGQGGGAAGPLLRHADGSRLRSRRFDASDYLRAKGRCGTPDRGDADADRGESAVADMIPRSKRCAAMTVLVPAVRLCGHAATAALLRDGRRVRRRFAPSSARPSACAVRRGDADDSALESSPPT